MRIADALFLQHLLGGAQSHKREMLKLERQISSGAAVVDPTQDPVRYREALLRDAQLARTASAKQAAALAESRLRATAAALDGLQQILVRARALAVQQSSATVSAAERQAAAGEVARLLDAALVLANRKWNGEALFGGTRTDRDPFVAGAQGVRYQGDQGTRTMVLDRGTTIPAGAPGGDPALTDAFQALAALKQALANNDPAAVRSALGALVQAHHEVTRLGAEVGGWAAHAASLQQALGAWEAEIKRAQSEREGADIPALVARVEELRAALEAVYLQVSRTANLSLARFLR